MKLLILSVLLNYAKMQVPVAFKFIHITVLVVLNIKKYFTQVFKSC